MTVQILCRHDHTLEQGCSQCLGQEDWRVHDYDAQQTATPTKPTKPCEVCGRVGCDAYHPCLDTQS